MSVSVPGTGFVTQTFAREVNCRIRDLTLTQCPLAVSGPGLIDRVDAIGRIPPIPETRAYVKSILGRLK